MKEDLPSAALSSQAKFSKSDTLEPRSNAAVKRRSFLHSLGALRLQAFRQPHY